MKRSVIFSIFVIASVYLVFAETPAITVTQSIRYADGNYVELLTPQISKAKALKTDKGKVLLRYDFSVEKSFSRNDIAVAIYVPLDVPIYPLTIVNAKPLEKLAKELKCDISNLEIVRETSVTNVYRMDPEYSLDYIQFSILGKEGTKATVEFQLDVSELTDEQILIQIGFWSISRKRGFKGVLRDYILPGVLLGGIGISGMLIKDYLSGEFNNEAFDDSCRTFTLSIAK